ncbi:UNVERIFIED_CONTAM: hypothetical protein FKN15_052631 [Acipenser sinensis]
MNTRCPPKRVPSAARFFTHCELTVQPPQSYSVGGQRRQVNPITEKSHLQWVLKIWIHAMTPCRV